MNLSDYLPRLNLQTVEFLKKIITPESLVFETGSGNSTIWFGKQVKMVVALEDDRNWCDLVRKLVKRENLQNIKLYFDPAYSKKQFKDILENKDIIEYDIVLHDGPFHARLRVSAMRFIHLLVKPGGYLIVDDTHDPQCAMGIKEHLDTLNWKKSDIPHGADAHGRRKSAVIYQRPGRDIGYDIKEKEETLIMELPDGWLHDSEAAYLAQLAGSVAEPKGSFLEVGSFQGRSSVTIGTEVKKLNSRLYCVDIWNKEMRGEDEVERQKIRKEYGEMNVSLMGRYFKGDMYQIFIENIKKWGLENTIIPIVGLSSTIRKAWKIPLRFIFIDGNHEEKYVREDCLWKRFLVVGGIICFHDYRPRGEVMQVVKDEMDNDHDFEGVGLARSVRAFRRIR